MRSAMITKSDWLTSMKFFMESPHRLITVSINLNRFVVKLTEDLEFYVVTPNTILTLSSYVLIKGFFTSYYKLDKELFFHF